MTDTVETEPTAKQSRMRSMHGTGEQTMTNDEAIYTLKNTAFLGWSEQAEKVSEAVRMAVEALKTQLPKEDTTSDCISRQEAIRIASGYCHPANVAKELAKLPSAQPEDCDTCKHGYFGDDQCERCRVRYPSHYERRTDGEIIPE